MSLFHKDYNIFSGVDIGTSNLKLVELSWKKDKYFLETYGIAEIESDIIRKSSRDTEIALGKVLQVLIKESGAKSKAAASSIPGFSVFSKVIKLPAMKESKLDEAVKWEAKKYVPFSIEDMVLNWTILEGRPLSSFSLPGFFKKYQKGSSKASLSREMEIFLTAVPKRVVNRYMNIFRLAGLKLQGLEPEVNSLVRALIRQGDKERVVAIIDIGSTATEINVLEQSKLKFSRNIDVGGKSITQALVKSLGVSFERAEQFKRDFGIQVEKDEAPGALKEIMKKFLEGIKYSFKLYSASASEKNIDKIILSGGTAKLKGLKGYLLKNLDIPVERADPWQGIECPSLLKESLPGIALEFAVAIGLAKRGLEGAENRTEAN